MPCFVGCRVNMCVLLALLGLFQVRDTPPPLHAAQKKLPSPALAAEAHHQSIVTVKTM